MSKNLKKISVILPNLLGGGAEKNFILLAEEWQKKKIKTDFILLKKEGVYFDKLPKNTKIFNLNASKIRHSFLPIYNFLKKTDTDVVLVNLWPLTIITIIANLLLFKKHHIIFIEHQILSKSYSKKFNNFRWYLGLSIKIFYKFANKVFCVSNAVKNDLIKLGVSKNHISVLNNPIELSNIYEKRLTNKILEFKKNKKLILSVGSFKVEKDFHSLLKAFILLKSEINSKLIIVGDGPLFKDIKQFINLNNLDDDVYLPGFMSQLYPFYLYSDLFVLPSIHEGFGNVIVESLSVGTPVVVTNSGGPVEILENEKYGLVANTEDPEDLSKKILNKLNNPDKSEKLILKSKLYSKEKISDLYLDNINKNLF